MQIISIYIVLFYEGQEMKNIDFTKVFESSDKLADFLMLPVKEQKRFLAEINVPTISKVCSLKEKGINFIKK
jgi:hypothetical protein